MLACVEESFWLVDGEDHLGAMLEGKGGYPTPVGCIRFASADALEAELGRPMREASLWAVHPAIIERLRNAGELLEITVAPD